MATSLQRLVALVIALVTGASLTACSEGAAGSGADESTLTIGWIVEQTGPWASYGNEAAKAAQLAAARLGNEGYNVKLVMEDSKSTPEGAIAAVQRLLRDDSVDVVAGITPTQLGQAVEPILEGQKKPAVFVSVANIKNKNGNVLTMIRPNGPLQDTLVNEYLAPNGAKRLAIIWQEQPTLEDNRNHLTAAAKAAGIEVVVDRGTSLGTTDFAPQISAVLSARPDVVSLNVLTQAAGSIISELRQRGYEGQIVAHSGVASPLLVEVGGAAVDGLVLPTFWIPTVDNSVTKEFIAAFSEAYPDDPTPQHYGMIGYDLVNVLKQAADRANSTAPDKLLASLREGTFETGMNPEFRFDEHGYGVLDDLIIEYRDGEPQPLTKGVSR